MNQFGVDSRYNGESVVACLIDRNFSFLHAYDIPQWMKLPNGRNSDFFFDIRIGGFCVSVRFYYELEYTL